MKKIFYKAYVDNSLAIMTDQNDIIRRMFKKGQYLKYSDATETIDHIYIDMYFERI